MSTTTVQPRERLGHPVHYSASERLLILERARVEHIPEDVDPAHINEPLVRWVRAVIWRAQTWWKPEDYIDYWLDPANSAEGALS